MNYFFEPGEWPFWYEYYAGSKECFEQFPKTEEDSWI